MLIPVFGRQSFEETELPIRTLKKSKFKELKNKLEAFENLQIINQDYILAAEFSNECRKNGIRGGHIDFLICAVAARNKIPIFTCDNDFKQYSKIIKIELY